MKNLGARIAMSSQNTRVRAHSGRDPTTGKSRIGAPADAFEIVFRRMRSQASLAEPGAADSPSQRNPGSARGPSPPLRAKVASFMRGQDRTPARPPTITRESGLPPRAEAFGANMEVRTADAVLPVETADVSMPGFKPASSAVAMMVPLAEEAVLGTVAAEAEQFIAKSGAELPAKQFTSESLQIPSAEQFLPESVVGTAAATQGNGVIALDGKAEFVLPLIDGTVADAKAVAFMGKPQDAMQSADMSAYFPQEAAGEFRAGVAQAGFVLDIPAHVSDAFLAGDASTRGQPQGTIGSTVGPLTEISNGGTLQQLAPEQAVVHTTRIGREQLVDQIVRGVRVAQHSKATEVIVQLKPDFLGRLSIRVLADDHAMRVEIRAESEAVRQVMQDSLADLQQRLSEKGFTFDQFNVLADTGSNPQREPEWESGSSPVAPSTVADMTLEDASTEQALLAANGVIDYFA